MHDDFVTSIAHLPHHSRQLAAGELVFERDDPVTSCFVIRAGEVHLLRRQMDGGRVVLQRAREGAVLAEASLNTPLYHCSAVTIRPTTLAVFSRRQIQELIARDPKISNALNRHLTAELRNTRMRMEILSLKKVGERLDAWLVWHDNILPDKGDWHRLAGEIGVSPEALYRELARRRQQVQHHSRTTGGQT